MHDRLYELGFTEAAGNFQDDNFGRGGVPGDRIIAYAQYGADLGYGNNGMFIPAPDGTSGMIVMFVFTGPAYAGLPKRDSDLDAEVILHELTHGLSSRLVGGGVLISEPQTIGLGEGWSDFYDLSLLSEEDDDVRADYPNGAYIEYQTQYGGRGFTENYYYGARRYPYSTDLSVNPLTLKDVDPSQADYCSSEAPYTSEYGPCTTQFADYSHDVGEVWCVTLWEARANLIERYGWQIGNQLILELVTDGMKLCPANPNFIQARDAILLADRVDTGGANQDELWRAFARRGMGWGASAPASSTTIGVVESFDLPPEGTQLWSYTTGNAVSSSPAAGPDGPIYVGSSDGYLYAIWPDGQLRWAFTEPAQYISFNSAPMVGQDGIIYARRRDGYLYAINPDGTRKWKTLLDYDSYVSPALGPDGTIYVAGFTDLKAIRPDDGAILWSFPTGNTIYSSPAIAPDGTIYFGGMDTKLYAVDPNTHQVQAGWPVVTGGYVASSPALGRDGTIYAGSADGKLYALNPDGTYKWSPVTLGSGAVVDSSPAIGPDGTVYVGSQDYKVYAVDSNTGQIKPGWPYTTGFRVRSSPAVAADGTVFVGSYDGKVYALNPDGTSASAPWPFYTGSAIFSSPALGVDGTVYIGSGNGKLYALSGVSGVAHSTWPMFRQNPWHTGNPATLALASGSRAQDGSFQCDIHGLSGMTCQVEGSDNLIAWNPLPNPSNPDLITLPSSGVATCTDAQAGGYAYRFYRVRSDSILSYNSLGFMAVNVPSGYSMIANQLDHSINNTIGVLLPAPPEGTTLYKWDEVAQDWVIATFVMGEWDLPNLTLSPGEGALVLPAAPTTFTFVGEVKQGVLGNPFPANLSIRSSIVPQTGSLDTALGFAPLDGDLIERWNTESAGYDLYVFIDGYGWDPATPMPRVGESFWINRPAPGEWDRTFRVW